MDRLITEANPPEGRLASPIPQYRRKDATLKINDEYEAVKGQNGAPYAQLVDINGNPLTPATGDDIATLKNELALMKTELETIKANQLSGEQKVQVSGTIEALGRRLYPAQKLPIEPLTIPTYDGSGQVVHPSVLHIPEKFGGHTWWMAITPYPGGSNRYENPSILCSDDGVTWKVPDGLTNPIVPAPPVPAFNHDPCLVYRKSDKKMYLYWQVGGQDPQLLKRIESSDGITWGNEQTCAVNPYAALLSPAICFEDSGTDWRMLAILSSELWLYTSPDGISWTREMSIVGVSDGMLPYHNSVYKDTAGYHLITASYVRGSGAPTECDLRYGFGTNLYNIAYDNTHVAKRGELGDWSAHTLYQSSLTFDKGTPYLYVSAMANNIWRVGRIQCQSFNKFVEPTAKTYTFVSGSDLTLTPGSAKKWVIQQDKRRVLQIALRLTDSKKAQLQLHYANVVNKESLFTETVYSGETAFTWAAIEVVPKHPYFAIQLKNTDISDLTVRSMFVTSE